MADFTGGLDVMDDYPLTEQPEGQPTFGENHAFWVFDEDSRIYINTHINTIETFWPLRRETVSVCLPAGRALVGLNEGALTTNDTVGGANLTMKCIEPFNHWTLQYQGTLIDTTQEKLAAGPVHDEKRVVPPHTAWEFFCSPCPIGG